MCAMFGVEHRPTAYPDRRAGFDPGGQGAGSPLRVGLAHPWRGLHHDRRPLGRPRLLSDGHMPVHPLRVDEMTIGSFASATVLNFHRKEISNDVHSNALIRLNLRKLLR